MSYRRSSLILSSAGNFDPASPGAIGGTTPAAGTFTTLLGADRGSQVFNAQAFDWLPDGTDRSTQMQNLLATVYSANGGTIYFPQGAGKYRADSQFRLLNDGASQPNQPSIMLLGAGSGVRSGGPISCSCLDLRYIGAGGKIETLGLGALQIQNLTITDGGSSNATPLLHSTNTTLMVSSCGFRATVNALQDHIVLGGTSANIGGATTDAFQGYATTIERSQFLNGNRGLFARKSANSVNFNFNSFGNNTGTVAIETDQGNAGIICIGNLIQMNSTYNYGIKIDSTRGLFIGNSFWDTAQNPDYISDFFFSSTAFGNTFVLGYHENPATVFSGDAVALKTSTISGSYGIRPLQVPAANGVSASFHIPAALNTPATPADGNLWSDGVPKFQTGGATKTVVLS